MSLQDQEPFRGDPVGINALRADFEAHTKATTQFLVIPFTEIGQRYLKTLLGNIGIPMAPTERLVLDRIIGVSDWILDNPTNPNVGRVSLRTERTIFSTLAPFFRCVEVSGDQDNWPNPQEWMKQLVAQGSFGGNQNTQDDELDTII